MTKQKDEPKISSLDKKADEEFIPSGFDELDELIGGDSPGPGLLNCGGKRAWVRPTS